jgi:CelD/BcsL family acetyltransferase involved in cellulose biosynthesis
MPDATRIILLRSTAALEAFVPQWKDLWKEDSEATPFQTPEWLLPWWHQFGQNELRATVVLQHDRPVAFLPFYIYSDPSTGERKLLLMGAGTTDYLGGLFSPTCTLEQVQCGVQAILRSGGWDSLTAMQMKPGSLLYKALRQEYAAQDLLSESCSRMPALSIEHLPPKIRRNALYYRNRAQRTGNLELQVAEASNCIEIFNTLQTLHTQRWNLRGEPGVLADQHVIAWHREAIPLLQSEGLLRLCSLLLRGKPLGILYSLIDPPWRTPRVQYFYLTAFSPDHAELRPGTLLLAYAIEHAAREGVEIIDMLRGQEAYKDLWHMQRTDTVGMNLKAIALEMTRTA